MIWGGLLEILYESCENREEIPAPIRKIKAALDKLESCKKIKKFKQWFALYALTKEQQNYINSPLYDELRECQYSNSPLQYAITHEKHRAIEFLAKRLPRSHPALKYMHSLFKDVYNLKNVESLKILFNLPGEARYAVINMFCVEDCLPPLEFIKYILHEHTDDKRLMSFFSYSFFHIFKDSYKNKYTADEILAYLEVIKSFKWDTPKYPEVRLVYERYVQHPRTKRDDEAEREIMKFILSRYPYIDFVDTSSFTMHHGHEVMERIIEFDRVNLKNHPLINEQDNSTPQNN